MLRVLTPRANACGAGIDLCVAASVVAGTAPLSVWREEPSPLQLVTARCEGLGRSLYMPWNGPLQMAAAHVHPACWAAEGPAVGGRRGQVCTVPSEMHRHAIRQRSCCQTTQPGRKPPSGSSKDKPPCWGACLGDMSCCHSITADVTCWWPLPLPCVMRCGGPPACRRAHVGQASASRLYLLARLPRRARGLRVQGGAAGRCRPMGRSATS
jgi:hypothetical protein